MPTSIQADPVIQQQLAQHGITEKTGIYGQHKVQMGNGSPIRLDSIKGNSIPFQGFRTATKVARGKEGLASSACKTLDVLKSPSSLKADELLAALKTSREYTARLNKLGQLSETQKQDSLWAFASAVEKLSNTELASVYQVFTSAEMELLESALRHEGQSNPKAGDARSAASQLFDLQALILREMSIRVSNGILDDLTAKEPAKAEEYAAMRPVSLGRQYAEVGSVRPQHEHDISAANLHTLANVAAQSATQREKSAVSESQRLSSRGLSATPKEMGDILRNSPLTINLPPKRLLRDTSFILHPNEPMPNVFHMQDQGIASKGEGYMRQRDETEKLVFPELEGHDAIADERPVYGALNLQQDQSGPASRSYGSCVIELKPEVARRSTFIAEDTFFSPALSITPGRRANFYALLDGSGLPVELVTELKKADSPAHQAMEAYLDLGAGISGLNAAFLKNPPAIIKNSEDDAQEKFAAVALQAFGDKEATRSKVASYDNLESLLPGLDDLNGALLADAAERRAAGMDDSVRLCMNYIEAQIQGPLIPRRDFQEIRVDMDDVKPESRAQLIDRMERFHKETGVKVTYFTSEAIAQEFPEVQERVEAARDDAARIGDQYFAGVRYFAQHIRGEAERAMGDAMEHIQDRLHALVQQEHLEALFPAEGDVLRGSILSELKAKVQARMEMYFKQPGDHARTAEDIVTLCVNEVAKAVLEQKAVLLRRLDAMPLTAEQKEGIGRWVRSSKVRTPEELQMAVENAAQQADALRRIAEADQPLSAGETFTLLAQAARGVDERMAAYASSLPPSKEYGTDDKNADLDRSISLAYTLLRGAEPPLTEAQIQSVYARLNTPEMRSMTGMTQKLIHDQALQDAEDYGSIATAAKLLVFHLGSAARQAGERFVLPDFMAELSLMPESSRAQLRQVAPETMRLFDAAHPAYTSFPVPVDPAAMPATDAARRSFLLQHLDSYMEHERTFDRGRSTHGRGHVARAYIFASTMCSILEEQGIPVDRNAVLCGITGHDVGRKGSGTDKWEKDSAAMTVGFMCSDFGGGSMGADYEQGILDTITKKSASVEAMIFKAADSLDIGRTQTLDIGRMPFLRGKEGESVSQEAVAMRAALAKEADLFQRISNPLCRVANVLQKIAEDVNHTSSPLEIERLSQQKRDLLGAVAEAFEAEWELSAEQFMAHMEKIIRDNPQMFPVLSKYYR